MVDLPLPTIAEQILERISLDLAKISQNFAKVDNKKGKQMAFDEGRRRRGGAFQSNWLNWISVT